MGYCFVCLPLRGKGVEVCKIRLSSVLLLSSETTNISSHLSYLDLSVWLVFVYELSKSDAVETNKRKFAALFLKPEICHCLQCYSAMLLFHRHIYKSVRLRFQIRCKKKMRGFVGHLFCL